MKHQMLIIEPLKKNVYTHFKKTTGRAHYFILIFVMINFNKMGGILKIIGN